MTETYVAQMALHHGRWRLYVGLLGVDIAQWPGCSFVGSAVPTLAERSGALNALGYVFTDGAEWQWVEDSYDPDDPSSPVRLIAHIDVEEAAG